MATKARKIRNKKLFDEEQLPILEELLYMREEVETYKWVADHEYLGTIDIYPTAQKWLIRKRNEWREDIWTLLEECYKYKIEE